MQIPSWLSLSQLSGYPVGQIGEWGKLLARLYQNAVPVPPMMVVPTQTLHRIAETNRLTDKLTQAVLKNQQDPEKLRHNVLDVFMNLDIPRDIARDLITGYHSVIQGNLAKIDTSSSVEMGKGLSIDLIQGDANTLESLLELWAISYLKTKQLTSSAFIIQQQLQPSFSGFILTKDTQGGSAKQMPVWVTKGALPKQSKNHPFSRYLVDVRTWNITFRQEVDQQFQLVRKAETLKNAPISKSESGIVTESLLAKIAQTAHQVKLLYLPHSCITWEMSDNQIRIVGLTPLGEEKLPQVAPATTTSLLQGTTVVPGYVSGNVIIGHPTVPPTQLPASSILVVSEVTATLKPYLRHAVGLISEKPLPLFAKQLIEHSLLPTVAPARDALKRLRHGQRIMLDAGRGLISASAAPVAAAKPTIPFTKTKVMLSVNNPAKTKGINFKESDGTFFSSDFTFYQQGLHPNYLIKSAAGQQFSQVLADRIKLFKPQPHVPLLYQPLNLTSAELIQLQYAHSYEQPEANPFLGYRGSIRHLHSFAILDAELSALRQAQQSAGHNLGLVIPFTRTVGELRLMLNHIRSFFPHQPLPFEIWWKISLPSNVWQIQQFLTPQLTGVIISIPDLHALMHGIDPANPDLLLKYPLDAQLMSSLIKQVHKACPDHKILLHLEQGYDDLAQLAVELGLAGVIVKPYHAVRTKRIISEIETHVLNHI